nr:hypothetical protein Iba_chr12fCG22020 [Ipomoea batatas]
MMIAFVPVSQILHSILSPDFGMRHGISNIRNPWNFEIRKMMLFMDVLYVNLNNVVCLLGFHLCVNAVFDGGAKFCWVLPMLLIIAYRSFSGFWMCRAPVYPGVKPMIEKRNVDEPLLKSSKKLERELMVTKIEDIYREREKETANPKKISQTGVLNRKRKERLLLVQDNRRTTHVCENATHNLGHQWRSQDKLSPTLWKGQEIQMRVTKIHQANTENLFVEQISFLSEMKVLPTADGQCRITKLGKAK